MSKSGSNLPCIFCIKMPCLKVMHFIDWYDAIVWLFTKIILPGNLGLLNQNFCWPKRPHLAVYGYVFVCAHTFMHAWHLKRQYILQHQVAKQKDCNSKVIAKLRVLLCFPPWTFSVAASLTRILHLTSCKTKVPNL